jgi:O-antigen/teichoic acid export membrane protein
MQKKKIFAASSWILGGYLISQLLRLGSNIVLTRLLIPEMFGVMAIVTTINMGVYLFTDIGLKQNIIRHAQGLEPEYFNTAWTLKVIRGIFLCIVFIIMGYGLRWWGENFDTLKDTAYGYPELPLILLVTGINSLITGFSSTNIFLAQRNLQLNRLTVLELISQIFGLAISIVWAYYEKNIWGFVFGNLIATIMTTFLSHFMLRGGKNKFYWDKAIVSEFLHFGKWQLASTIITFFALHGDKIILGKFLSTEKMGIYAIAFFLADSVNTILSKVTDGVFFPVLSETWRKNQSALKNSYYKIRMAQDTFVLLVAGFIYNAAPVIIDILYDDRYKDAGLMLQILSITVIGLNYTLGSKLLTILGYPYVRTVIVAAKAVFLWTAVPAALHVYGIVGGLYAISCNMLIEIIILVIALYKYKMLSFYREFMMLPVWFVGFGLGHGFVIAYHFLAKQDFHEWFYLLQKQLTSI